MNTIPTIAAGFPSLRAAAWIGQGRAFERRFPVSSATGAPRCYHPFGQRARQRTCCRFTRKLKTLRINWHLRRAARLLWLSSRHHEAVKRLRRRIAP